MYMFRRVQPHLFGIVHSQFLVKQHTLSIEQIGTVWYKNMDHNLKVWTMIQRHGPRFVVLSLVSQFKMQVICVSLYNLCEYGENRNTYKLLGDSCYTLKFPENSSITESN